MNRTNTNNLFQTKTDFIQKWGHSAPFKFYPDNKVPNFKMEWDQHGLIRTKPPLILIECYDIDDDETAEAKKGKVVKACGGRVLPVGQVTFLAMVAIPLVLFLRR